MERFEIHDNQFIKKNVVSSLPDIPDEINKLLLDKWSSRIEDKKYKETIGDKDIECTKVNHYLRQYYNNIKSEEYDYRELIVGFLNAGDVLYALTVADIILRVARKAQTIAKASNSNVSSIDEFILSLDDLRYKIEHDKDLYQNVKRDGQLDEQLENARNAIYKELIYKIDGATALAKEIGTDQFIQYAIDQSYFFEPGIVKNRMVEIVGKYSEWDELYARRSAKILADDDNDILRPDKGDTGKGDYSQKIDYVRTACAPIKIIADKVTEQADMADKAAKKAAEYADLIDIVFDAPNAAVAAKKAVASAVKKATKKDANTAKEVAIIAIGKAMEAINKANDAINGNQAIIEEIKSDAKDAKDAISAAKEAITFKVSDADENTKKAAEAIKKFAKTVKRETAEATKAAANAAEKATKEVTKIKNVSLCISPDAVDEVKKAANKVRLVAATKDDALKAKTEAKTVADTAKNAAEAAQDAVNKAINSIKAANNNGEQSEAPSNKGGESDKKGKDSKYYLFNSTEVNTFVNEIIVDYPIIIDNDGNAQVRSLITDSTGYLVGAGKDNIFQNYRISHVWGRAYDPRFFTNLWNLVLVPSWANDLLDKPNARQGTLESKLQSTIMRICKILYFNDDCVSQQNVIDLNLPKYPEVINEGKDVVGSSKELDKGLTIPDERRINQNNDNSDKPYIINIIEGNKDKDGKEIKKVGDIVKYAVYV